MTGTTFPARKKVKKEEKKKKRKGKRINSTRFLTGLPYGNPVSNRHVNVDMMFKQEATGSLHFVRRIFSRLPFSSHYFSGFLLCYNILVNIQFQFRSPKSAFPDPMIGLSVTCDQAYFSLGREKVRLIQFESTAAHLSKAMLSCVMMLCHAINVSQSDFTENCLHVAIQGKTTKTK